MPATFLRSPAAVWLLLVTATLLSYASWLGESWSNARMAGSAVLVIAFFKARLIGLRFMELQDAAWPLRLLFEAWILVVGTLLLVMFWQAA